MSKTRTARRAASRGERGLMRRPVQEMTTAPGRGLVSEIVGRTTSPYTRVTSWRQSFDWTRPEYAFWSRLRRGKESGYELGGLFAKRICEIDAEWTLGRGFTVKTGYDDVDAMCVQFVQDNLDTLTTWRKDSSGLGDAYIVVNPDGSLSLGNPDTIEVLTDPLDYTTVVGYRITTTLETAVVEDLYTETERTITIRPNNGVYSFGGMRMEISNQAMPMQTITQTFPNLTGMLPVIHLPNDREGNEIYGHPIYEAELTLFGRYDDVLSKSLDGVEVMGRPIPVAEGLEDPALAQQQNATRTETVYNQDGTSETVSVTDFEDLTMLWLGKGGSFKFAGPGSFSADSVAMLKKLFYLMMEHIGIPEWTWGGALPGGIGGDSVAAQMPAFVRYLEGRRSQTQKAVLQLMRVWLATMRINLQQGFIPQIERVMIEWPDLMPADQAQTMAKAKQADDYSLITRETHLRLLDIVEDPAAEVQAAAAEGQARQQAMQDQMDAAIDAEMRRTAADDSEDDDMQDDEQDDGGNAQ